MKLYVDPLNTSAAQLVTVGAQNQSLSSVRLHLLRYGAPTGTLKLDLYDNATSGLIQSTTININTFPVGNYWHGFIQFSMLAGLKKNTSYKFLLTAAGGYTFSESAYIGWCGAIEPKYSATFGNAFDIEFWCRKSIQRGIY